MSNISVEFIAVAPLQINFLLVISYCSIIVIEKKIQFYLFKQLIIILFICKSKTKFFNLRLYDNHLYKLVIFGRTFQYDSNSKWNQKILAEILIICHFLMKIKGKNPEDDIYICQYNW